MCKFFKKEASNHHFPELKKTNRLLTVAQRVVTGTGVTIAMLVITVIVGASYFFQTNVSTTQGYQIRTLEEQLGELKDANTDLKLRYIELQSMANVIDQASELKLVATGNVEVIVPNSGVVARR
jgi:cell division protein FtsL